jgi:hypothetical protein
MSAGVWNVIIGLVMLAGGLSGRFSLLFTNSSLALAVVGGVIAAVGGYQIVRARGGRAS